MGYRDKNLTHALRFSPYHFHPHRFYHLGTVPGIRQEKTLERRQRRRIRHVMFPRRLVGILLLGVPRINSRYFMLVPDNECHQVIL